MRYLISMILVLALAVSPVAAQTITPTGINQGDLVALLQNIVDALGSTVGSTYLTAGTAVAISAGALTLSGVLSSSSGTSAAPGLIFGTDVDTGFYHPNSNVIGFANAGAVSAILNANNNLTLGASDLASAADKLYVNGVARVAADNSGLVYLQDTNDNSSEVALKTYVVGLDEEGQAVSQIGHVSGTDNNMQFSNLIAGTDIKVQTKPSGGALTAGIWLNDTQNTTFGASDLATTKAKVYVDGAIALNTYANGATIATPDTGDVKIFCEFIGGKESLQLMFDDGSTVEIAIKP